MGHRQAGMIHGSSSPLLSWLYTMYASHLSPVSSTLTPMPPNVPPNPFWNYVYSGPLPQAIRPTTIESGVTCTNFTPRISGQNTVKILPKSSDSRPSARAISRKQNKPETEKRRRQRINRALEQLKHLVTDKTGLPKSGFEKIEKADILERAVGFIRQAVVVNTDQSRQSAGVTKPAQSTDLARMFLYGFVSCESNILQICNNLLNTVQCRDSQPPLPFLSEIFSQLLAELTKRRADALVHSLGESPANLLCVIPPTTLTNSPSTSSPPSTDSAPGISPQQLTPDSGLAMRWNSSPTLHPVENSCQSPKPIDWSINSMERNLIQRTTQHTEVWRPW
ncbi:transcription factor HES-4 [Clonorchis sinensis]|uniref:Transcription factor HES-4 n=1 Tax=Clonorchis sinensis TaxID=79923 RepID=G7YTV9_CLOSI|nr:transcription factor HES-4 [Clonorchis sinensis]